MTDEERREAEERYWKQKEEDIAMWKGEEYELLDYEKAVAERIAPVAIYLKIAEDAAELSRLAAMVARKGVGGPQIDIFDKSYETLRREYLIAQMNLAQCVRILYNVHDRYGRSSGLDIFDQMVEVENSNLGLERAMQWVEDIDNGMDSYMRGEIYHSMYLYKKMLDGIKKKKVKDDTNGT